MIGRCLIRGVCLVFVAFASRSVPAQQSGTDARTIAELTPAEIRFEFENAQLQPSRFEMVIREDGSGHFRSEPGPTSSKSTGGIEAGSLDQDIVVRDPLRSSLFATARARKAFAVECEAKAHVAYRGKKVLSYKGPDGQGSCTFNWSKDNQIETLSDELEAVASTLEYGRRLAVEHQHDRLALDAELQFLAESMKNKGVMELENIAPILTSIAEDETVMARARQRARWLLPDARHQ